MYVLLNYYQRTISYFVTFLAVHYNKKTINPLDSLLALGPSPSPVLGLGTYDALSTGRVPRTNINGGTIYHPC